MYGEPGRPKGVKQAGEHNVHVTCISTHAAAVRLFEPPDCASARSREAGRVRITSGSRVADFAAEYGWTQCRGSDRHPPMRSSAPRRRHPVLSHPHFNGMSVSNHHPDARILILISCSSSRMILLFWASVGGRHWYHDLRKA